MTVTQKQLNVIRAAFAINIVAAGVPGFLIVFFPAFAEVNVLGAAQDLFTMGIVGSVWLAIGALSILGLFYPLQLAPIFLVQIIYKSVWIVAVALPLLAAGDARALPFIVFFSLAVGLFAYAVPFRALFARPTPGDEPAPMYGSIQS